MFLHPAADSIHLNRSCYNVPPYKNMDSWSNAGKMLLVLFQPFLASRKPSRRTVLVLIALSWTISLFLAMLPFSTSLQYIFTTKAIIPNNLYFQNVMVDFNSAKQWAETLLTFIPETQSFSKETVLNIRNAVSWVDLQSSVANVSAENMLNIKGFIG